jgi:hypothetical protein
MPANTGDKHLPKSGKKSATSSRNEATVLHQKKAISRSEALSKVKKLLSRKSTIPSEALDLISLFYLHTDELTEAGVSYEVVRALEKRHPMLLID